MLILGEINKRESDGDNTSAGSANLDRVEDTGISFVVLEDDNTRRVLIRLFALVKILLT